ncbi:hypothetical protein PanWU01x14_219000 [Parasponia andersonii]|uniref:Uncharacterized protein n=1 Tax=Parasponia andersonii TaxID=3476 RepID=A0A2P5BQG4_PARAD|nr:hypothetical protein PanWU01x14_219000 [Parasponia andersonii]
MAAIKSKECRKSGWGILLAEEKGLPFEAKSSAGCSSSAVGRCRIRPAEVVHYHLNASDDPHVVCPHCNMSIDVEIDHIVPPDLEEEEEEEGGKQKHHEASSGIEKRLLDISIIEGLKLLQASWQCETALNTVFLDRVDWR